MTRRISKVFLFSFVFLALSAMLFAPTASAFSIWQGTSCAPDNRAPVGPCSFCDALKVTANIVQFLFKVAIPIAVAMIVWGAFRMMTSGGSEQNVESGKKTVTSAVIGLVIVLAAWIIINTVLHLLAGGIDFPWNEINCS